MANLVKFGRGTMTAEAVQTKDPGMIYFNTSTHEIYLNGAVFGVSSADAAVLSGSIKEASYNKATGKITFTKNDGTSFDVTLDLATTSNAGLMSAGQVTQLESNTTAIQTLNGEAATEGSVKHAIATSKSYTDDELAKAALSELVGNGQAVVSISQANGKVSASLGNVSAANVDLADAGGNFEAVTVEAAFAEVATDINALEKDVTDLKTAVGEGGSVADAITAAIEALDVDKQSEEGKYIKTITQTDGKVAVEFGQVAASEVSVADSDNLYNGSTVEVALKEVMTKANAVSTLVGETSVESQINAKIDALAGSATSTGGERVEVTVTTENGEVTGVSVTENDIAKASDLTALSNTVGTPDEGKTVVEMIKSVDSAAKSYSVAKVTTGLEANVLEAYQLVETVGEDSANVGEVIKIYKDSSLKSISLEGTDGSKQELVYVYTLADGTDKTVRVDVSKFLAEAEFKNGLEVSAAGEVSVKVDSTSEYLSVSANGVKVSGIDAAIASAIEALDATVGEKTVAEGKHVAVEVVETDGVITAVNVAESDIASAKSLSDEIARAKAAEDTIEASVGLSAEGAYVAPAASNYLTGSTSVMDALSKLDANIKSQSAKATTVVAEGTDAGNNLSIASSTDEAGATTYTISLSDVASKAALDQEILDRQNAIADLDATVGSQDVAEGKHVAVEVVETDGKLTGLTVVESDIASAAALEAEVNRAKDAEKANSDAIAIINGEASQEGSIKKAIADANAYTDTALTWFEG